MGFSSWAGRRRSCMTFFGPSMTEKTGVEARARNFKYRGVPGYGGWSGPSNARRFAAFSHTRTRVGARHWALTEPERGVRLLNLSRETTANYGTRMAPCWFSRGKSRCTNSRPMWGSMAQYIWCIDGGNVVSITRAVLPRLGPS